MEKVSIKSVIHFFKDITAQHFIEFDSDRRSWARGFLKKWDLLLQTVTNKTVQTTEELVRRAVV